nr:DnaB-like helicase C-terminal domain-containing protein [Cyanobacterium sp. IPPAS B-1200]OEJ78062.1 hypothetical protein A5482_14480 [Cyanobacterium sp. IPPAS B-1200]
MITNVVSEKSVTDNGLFEQYYRLMLFEDNQRYAVGILEGNALSYPHQKDFLTTSKVEKSISGELSLGVMLIQTSTNLVKAGCIDIDTPRDAKDLSEGLALAKKLQETAKELNLKAYIEFSGNRGYHLWIFANKPIFAGVMMDCLKGIAQKANFKVDEIFPNHRSKESKCIKLPGTTHLKSNKRCGFIDDSFNPTQPEVDLSLQGELMAGFVQNDSSPIIEAVDQVSFDEIIGKDNQLTNQEKQAITEKLKAFGDNHPSCINHLMGNGIPLDIDYNHGNLTLVRYCLTRGYTLKESLPLAKTVAENTSLNHPTSKTTIEAKANNFKSAFNSAKNNPDGYGWECSYAMEGCGGKSGVYAKDRGCSNQCSLYSKKLNTLYSPPKLPLNSFIYQAAIKLSSEGKEPCKSQIMRQCENLISSYDISGIIKDNISDSRLLLEKEVIANIIQNPESALGLMEIYPDGFKGVTDKNLSQYIDELMILSLPNEETLREYVEVIREEGIKVVAKKHLEETAKELDSEETVINTLTQSIDTTEGLLNKSVDNKSIAVLYDHLPSLIENLYHGESVAIPTLSPHLNNILNGGFQKGKLYVIAAPPASGKTTFCSWVADYASIQGYKVCYGAYEMSREEMFVNSLARFAGVKSNLIEGRKWRYEDYPEKDSLEKKLNEKIVEYAEEIAQNAYYLECDDTYNPQKLRLVAKKIEADLLVVDYLQLLTSGDEKLDNTFQETLRVSKIATELKRLARDLNIPVIAISDINKKAYQDSMVGGN